MAVPVVMTVAVTVAMLMLMVMVVVMIVLMVIVVIMPMLLAGVGIFRVSVRIGLRVIAGHDVQSSVQSLAFGIEGRKLRHARWRQPLHNW